MLVAISEMTVAGGVLVEVLASVAGDATAAASTITVRVLVEVLPHVAVATWSIVSVAAAEVLITMSLTKALLRMVRNERSWPWLSFAIAPMSAQASPMWIVAGLSPSIAIVGGVVVLGSTEGVVCWPEAALKRPSWRHLGLRLRPFAWNCAAVTQVGAHAEFVREMSPMDEEIGDSVRGIPEPNNQCVFEGVGECCDVRIPPVATGEAGEDRGMRRG